MVHEEKQCLDLLFFITLDDQIKLQTFQNCGKNYKLVLEKNSKISGDPSKILVDKRNLILVTNTHLYVYNFDLKMIAQSERDTTLERYSEVILSNYQEGDLKLNQLRVLSFLGDNEVMVEEFLCQTKSCVFQTYEYESMGDFGETLDVLVKPNSNMVYLYTPNTKVAIQQVETCNYLQYFDKENNCCNLCPEASFSGGI